MMYLKNMVRGMDDNAPAKQLIEYWEHDAGSLKFWRASSNFVYVFYKDGRPYYLRFIHEDDNSSENIQAEIDFLQYLLDKGYPAAAPVRSRQGRWIETIITENGRYHGVVFEQANGVHIPIDQMSELHFQDWGKSLASLHKLSESYEPTTTLRRSWVDILDFVMSVLQNHPREYEALKECDRMKIWLSKLPSGTGHTGLIHFDFETDNVFYIKNESRFSAIDFDDSMYHWFMMDITSTLSDLMEQKDDQANKNIQLFIKGYRTVKHLDNEYIEMLPWFQRFGDLYTFTRLLRCMENMDLLNLPEWVIQLKQKFFRKCDQIRIGFKANIELKKITENNWYACTQLEVSDDQ